MAAPHTIDSAMCERFVNVAAKSCIASAQPAPAPHEPPWDALANSFASLSAAFAWGAILLALIAIVAAIGWGVLVRHWAEREARVEADECVRRLMDKWLVEEAPQIVRRHVELLQNASLGNDNEQAAADDIGKEAG